MERSPFSNFKLELFVVSDQTIFPNASVKVKVTPHHGGFPAVTPTDSKEYQAAESAAALLVYKDAFERANSFDKEKVRDALAQTDMQTFYGNVKFHETGQNIAKPMVLFQVRCEGDTCENKVVAPTKWASAALVHPIPKWSER